VKEYSTHDPNALEFMHGQFPDSKKHHGDRYLATCPSCGAKHKFWWTENLPHYGGCHACGYELNSVYDLGYRTANYRTKSLSDLSNPDNLALFYQNKTGKRHRLSPRVISEFNLQALQFQKKSGIGFYYNLAIPDNATLGCIKHLNFDGRWISVQSKYRNERRWHNTERIKPTDEHLFVLAGEWDMFAFWEHTGIHGISPVDGEPSSGRLTPEHYDIFSNKKVVILYDNDKAGRDGAKSLAIAINKRVKTKWIRSVNMANLGSEGGEDIDDFFSSGGTKERLWAEIESTPNFSPDLVQEDYELARVKAPFDRPELEDSVLTPEILDKIWKTMLLPEAKRTFILSEIADGEGYNKEMSPALHKERIKIYRQELESLRYKAFDILIDNWFQKYHIKQATRFSEMSEALYYYYSDGFYQFLSEEFLIRSSDEIAKQITPPDERVLLSKARKQALEDIRIKLVEAKETNFDSHKDYINFSNGTYVLKDRSLVPHSPDFLLNYKLPIQYNPDADCNNFKEALNDWTHNAEDKKELLKALYYLISGDRSKSIVLWLHGDGNDGKGEFIQLCKSLIGDKRTSSLALETIEKTHYTAELYNKMLNIADEVPKNFIIPDAMFKRISGNSVITGDPKYKGLISFVSKALWIIPSNHFPNVADTSHGYFRRFKIFQFKKIPKHKEIGHFFETKLRQELPGIVNLILTKGREYYETEGFIKTKSELESTIEMKEKNTAFLYWNSVTSVWENQIQDTMEELDREHDYSVFNDGGKTLRKDAILKIVKSYEDISYTDEFDVVQVYKRKSGDKIEQIWINNPYAHYKFYREFFKNDEVRLLSLSNFRASTINFFKDYYPERTIDKIRIWSKDGSSEKKKNMTYIMIR
jgi:P4 family phage/plasmid primase-like protien